MADNDERLEEANRLLRVAQGYMSDAEFREDAEMKQARYSQATASLLVALTLQQQVMLEMMKSREDFAGLDKT